MDSLDLSTLRKGDIIQNLGSGDAYVILYAEMNTIVAGRSLTVTNPTEWKLIKKSQSNQD